MGGYDGEGSRKFAFQKNFLPEFMEYDANGNFFICPANRKLSFVYVRKRKTANGFESFYHIYEAEDCSNCELKGCCHKQRGNRKIQVNHNLIRYRKKAREDLNSAKGKELRRRRGVEVESVFGQIKQNGNFRRFFLRGIEKVTIETGLLCLAHNIKKWHRALQQPIPA